MRNDVVDDILKPWSDERPELDTAPLGVVIRVMALYRSFLRDATKALEPPDLDSDQLKALGDLLRAVVLSSESIQTSDRSDITAMRSAWYRSVTLPIRRRTEVVVEIVDERSNLAGEVLPVCVDRVDAHRSDFVILEHALQSPGTYIIANNERRL